MQRSAKLEDAELEIDGEETILQDPATTEICIRFANSTGHRAS